VTPSPDQNVVERLRRTLRLGEKYPEEVTASLLTRRDAEALLAVVEAAKRDYDNGFVSQDLGKALARLDARTEGS